MKKYFYLGLLGLRHMFGHSSGLPHARLVRDEYILSQIQLSQLAK